MTDTDKSSILRSIKDLLDNEGDLSEWQVKFLADIEVDLERGRNPTITQLSKVGEILQKCNRVHGHARKFTPDGTVGYGQTDSRWSRNDHGHRKTDVDNIVSAMRESPHEATRSWCRMRSDDEIYLKFLQVNGYLADKPGGRTESYHTTEECKKRLGRKGIYDPIEQ